MPPFVARKRERTISPEPSPPTKRHAVKSTPKRLKKTVFQDAESLDVKAGSAEKAKSFFDAHDEDSGSELSDADDTDELEFEDVPAAKKRKVHHAHKPRHEDSEEDEDEEMIWEDATHNQASSSKVAPKQEQANEIGDLSISMNDDGSYVAPLVSGATGKKGPSKRERQTRIQTHCLHVQALLWHNTVRNSWVNDAVVQKALVDGLTEGVKREVTRYREAMGTLSKTELEAKKRAAVAKNRKGRKGRKSNGKETAGRDWSHEAEHREQGVPDLSRGDPILRLLKVLAAYWRKRFTITAPGIRKTGYMQLRQLRQEIKEWDKDRNNAEAHGERVENREAFRNLAKTCEGSRDVGAQLFVALLRGLGLETRMVANLQPAGIGWSKTEDAAAKKTKKKPAKAEQVSESESEEIKMAPIKPTPSVKASNKKARTSEQPSRKSKRGSRPTEPINLDDDDDDGSALSSPPSDLDDHDVPPYGANDDDDLSIIDLDPPIAKKPNKKYDRDMAFPNYWTEVLSPVTNKYLPVDPIVLSTIASNDELLHSFEPRGKKADVAKQVICYTVAFNSDGTAKDVTVRYLKRHQLPGKTKGMRMGVEKVPIHNRKGKVIRYEQYDWFRTVMSIYDRPENKRTIADDLEDQSDLKPFKPAKSGEKEIEKESLQWYKQSAEFVLEQHLRREEAIRPGAKPVKSFTATAKKGAATPDAVPVFKRSDVLTCKTMESWHKEGREVLFGEQPVKMVPVRAVTLLRKREMEEHKQSTGERLLQGLYSREQTDWIIPPPIGPDRKIPRNAFGNMDVYVPSMVPKGAVHLPLKGSAKLCKRLDIEFAEACTGFEFGKQRAVPVITGVVVAEENEKLIRDAWRVERAEQKRKEDTKRTELALKTWRKMLMGLRIVDRMQREYEGMDMDKEEINPFVTKARREGREIADVSSKTTAEAGGFLLSGDEVEDQDPGHSGGGFLASDDDEEQVQDNDGGFLVEDVPDQDERSGGFLTEDAVDDTNEKARAPFTPVSLQSTHKDEDEEEEEEESHLVSKKSKATNKAARSNTRKPVARVSTTKRSRKSPLTNGRPKPTTKKSQQAPASDTELSDLSDLASEADQTDSSSATSSGVHHGSKLTNKKATPSSPKVVVTPQISRRGKPGSNSKKSQPGKTSQSATNSKPVRSRYFATENGVDTTDEAGLESAEDVESDGESSDDFEESEEEVVKPRATTSRTRARTSG